MFLYRRQREMMNLLIMKFLYSLTSWLEFLERANRFFLVFDQHCHVLETLIIKWTQRDSC